MNRLRAAPWTSEDSDILWRLIVRGRWCGQIRTPLEYRDADRRDADIMLALGTLHISTGGDYSDEAIAGRKRMRQGFCAHPHALGFVWMPARLAAMSEKP